ncbi:hypothetical protein GCM10020331_101400 [Ectobacillus funiculus]
MLRVLELSCFSDGDVTGAIATSIDEMDVDILVGTGGAPEGVIAATALKCLGGDFQAQLVPQNQEEFDRCIQMGLSNPEKKVFTIDELVKSDDCFFVATGITDGTLLKGVQKKRRWCHANPFICGNRRQCKNFQFIEARH